MEKTNTRNIFSLIEMDFVEGIENVYLSVKYARKALLLPAHEIDSIGSGQRIPTLPAIEATIPWDRGDMCVDPPRSMNTLPVPALLSSPTQPHM